MDVANYKDIWAPGGPGSATKVISAAGAVVLSQIRPALAAGGFTVTQPPVYLSFLCADAALLVPAAGHLVFGDLLVADPTDADYPTTSVEWQRVIIPASVTHLKFKAHAATTVHLYYYLSGKQNLT